MCAETNNPRRWLRARTAVFALLSVGAPCLAQSPADLVAQGNEQFKAKNYDKAAELYKQAQAGTHAPAAAFYNEGCVLLEQGKPGDAADRFRAADAGATSDAELGARSRFNLGQALYREADAAKEKQADQALDLLRQSASAFRSVLEVNPSDTEAARNVEIARRLMKQIDDKKKEEQKKQDQKNGQNQQGQSKEDREAQQAQQQADQLKDLAQRQRQAANDSKQAQQQGADQQKTDQLQKQQQSIKDDTAKAQEQQKQSGGSQQSDQLQQAQGEQQEAMDDLQKQDPGDAQGHQEQAAKLLEQAAQQAQQKADQAKQRAQQAKADQQKGEKGNGQKMGDAEPKEDQNYDKLAESLLKRERDLRKQRQPVIRAERGVKAPVEKDW